MGCLQGLLVLKRGQAAHRATVSHTGEGCSCGYHSLHWGEMFMGLLFLGWGKDAHEVCCSSDEGGLLIGIAVPWMGVGCSQDCSSSDRGRLVTWLLFFRWGQAANEASGCCSSDGSGVHWAVIPWMWAGRSQDCCFFDGGHAM